MANIDSVTKNKLTIKAVSSERSYKIGLLMLGLPLVLLSGCLHPAVMIVSFAIPMLVFFFSRRDDPILRAGAEGEDMAIEMLKQLPEDYTIFNQVNIPNEKLKTGYNETDIIISGPTAIFLVEVKHNKGHVYGSEQDGRWQVVKVGRAGTSHVSSMRNPVKQVKGVVWHLSNHLKNKKAKPWIQGIVLFTNPQVLLSMSGETSVPVFQSSDILDYIVNFNTKTSRPTIVEKSRNELMRLKNRSVFM
jgi:hypothetical protein